MVTQKINSQWLLRKLTHFALSNFGYCYWYHFLDFYSFIIQFFCYSETTIYPFNVIWQWISFLFFH